MLYRKHWDWAAGVLLALAVGVLVAPSVYAAGAKAKTVRHTGIVTAVNDNSIRLQESHFLMRRINTYTLSPSPTVQLAHGSGAMSDVVVGTKVELVGTQGPDKKVTVTEIRVLAPPKKHK